MARQYWLHLIGFFFIFLAASCQFGDTNINPVRPTAASLDEIFPIALVQTYRNINTIGGRATGIVMQQFKGVDAQPLSYEQYLIDERTLDNLWRTGLYTGAMRDCQLLIEQAEIAPDAVCYAAIGRILLAHNLGLATTFWGDIPFSMALAGEEEIYPEYDRQEFIYAQIVQLLEQAIADLEQVSDTTTLASDLVFGGDPLAWRNTAYSLLARYTLHLGKRISGNATKVLDYLEQGGIATHDQEPKLFYVNNRNGGNPFALYLEERPGQIILGEFLTQLLQSTNDPRLPFLAREEGGEFILYDPDDRQFYWSQLDTPIPLISLSETLFIEAEALLRTDRVEQAELTFQEAVAAHFQQMGMMVADQETWIQTQINFADCAEFECRLQRLIEQKYIALFVQGAHEAWNDYRRTGWPDLQVPEYANASFNPELRIPRRYLYPLSERTANAAAYQKAIDRQGGHFMDVDTWIFTD